jgi:hypothetical protein
MATRRGHRGRAQALAATLLAGLALAVAPAAAGATTANPFFEATGSLYESRSNPAAVALADGRVLVAGGCHYASPQQKFGCTVATAELYDPEADTFAATGSMAIGRANAAAAPLPGGKALVVGGVNTEGPTYASAEVFDPEAETFSSTGSMAVPRWGAVAAPLPDGRVLVAGGANGSSGYKSAEIYDPEAGTFSATGSMAAEHRMAAAAPLPDGRVLVAGGFGSGGSAEIFDPETETFSATGSLAGVSLMNWGAALADGSVLVFGDGGSPGFGLPRSRDLELYDPATGTFSVLSLASPERTGMAVASLPGGRVLAAGGAGENPKAWLGHSIVPAAEVFVSAPSPRSDGLDFGVVPPAETSGPEAMTITNLGAQPLQVEAASLTGPDAADFEIVADECSSETLAFEESCELSIAVTPSSEAPLSAAVQLTDNAPSSPQSFPLSANAEEAPALQATTPASSPADDGVDATPAAPVVTAAPTASADPATPAVASGAAPQAAPSAVAPPTQRAKRPCKRAKKRSAGRCARPLAKRHRARAGHAS